MERRPLGVSQHAELCSPRRMTNEHWLELCMSLKRRADKKQRGFYGGEERRDDSPSHSFILRYQQFVFIHGSQTSSEICWVFCQLLNERIDHRNHRVLFYIYHYIYEQRVKEQKIIPLSWWLINWYVDVSFESESLQRFWMFLLFHIRKQNLEFWKAGFTKQDAWRRHTGLWETIISMFHYFLMIYRVIDYIDFWNSSKLHCQR